MRRGSRARSVAEGDRCLRGRGGRAAAVSLALTEALLILLRAEHPPAGATVLIVSLGLLSTPVRVLVMAASIVLITVTGWSINRICGVPMPIWSSHD